MKGVSVLVCSTIFIAGCAYNPPIPPEAEEELAKPIDCLTATEDIRILESEKISSTEQAKAGVKMIVPAAAARSILHRDYLDRAEVTSGQYNRDIDNKIQKIKDACGLK
ncbi:MAG: hypothetical protein PHU91_01820 [Candidatus Omnitrophica bacterium]|nr:hypothetical protein [Candidatus Omnitrophota bacterium]MDD5236393.1 hypothetical protein [Candidatus Omnitrophota bacterium]MDD5610685.1 hypothetical protein [Candidatus Omnitrophota bacterium]